MTTFTVDIFTSCWGIAIVLLAVAGCLANPFFRRLRWTEEETEEEKSDDKTVYDQELEKRTVPVSVLLPIHEAYEHLESHLEAFLSQDYPCYQVVAVGQKGDHAVEDVLKRLQGKYSHLYYTMIPTSSRYMSREKLQVTLGVKASAHEWIVLSSPTCLPGKEWLRGMAKHLTEENHMALGVVLLDEEAKGYWRFRHIRTLYYLLRKAQRGTALRTHMANVAFRKSDFIAGKGYQGNLQLVRGELDFLVNKYAEDVNCAVELSLQTWLVEEGLTRKTLRNRRLYLRASSKHLRHAASMKALRFFDTLLPYASLFASLGTIAYSAYQKDVPLLIFAVIALLTLFIARAVMAAKAVHRFDPSVSAWLMPFYELALFWSDLADRWHYMRSDKNDFTSHKL